MANSLKSGLWFILLLTIASNSVAQGQSGPTAEAGIRSEGIGGLIVDDTVTFIGRQFYDAFAIAWLDQDVANGQNLAVHEQPTAASGSRIKVDYDRQTLFEVFLPPTRADIETTAKRAAALVAQRFKTLELQRTLFDDPDLGPDEF